MYELGLEREITFPYIRVKAILHRVMTCNNGDITINAILARHNISRNPEPTSTGPFTYCPASTNGAFLFITLCQVMKLILSCPSSALSECMQLGRLLNTRLTSEDRIRNRKKMLMNEFGSYSIRC